MSASKAALRPEAALKIAPNGRTEDIVKQLVEVLVNLRNVESVEGHGKSAKNLAVHFAQEGFLDHPDNHVRALVAACLAEMFRIFVGTPEDVISSQEAPAQMGPYSDVNILRNVFDFLILSLGKFLNRKSSYYGLGYHVAQVLASTKAYMLIFSIEDHQMVLEDLVRVFFDVVSDAHTAADRLTFLDILVGLVGDEDTTLSHQMLAILLMPLTRTLKRQNPSAFSLARDLFKRVAKALEPCISAYFYQLMQNESFSDELEIRENIPELILELFEISPQLVTSTLKHLDQQISSGDFKERTNCLGLIDQLFLSPNFAECGTAERDLLVKFAAGRLNDIDEKARAVAVRVGQHFITSQNSNDEKSRVKDYVDNLSKRIMDPSPLVRGEAVKAFCLICKSALDFVPAAIIGEVGGRLMDKELQVREASSTAVCDLFHHLLYPGADTVTISNEKVRTKLGPLLVRLIDLICEIPDKTIEFKFLGKLLPPDAGDYVFSSHLVYFYICCGKKGRTFFQDTLKRNHRVRVELLDFLSGEGAIEQAKRVEFKKRLFALVSLFKNMEKGVDALIDMIRDDRNFRRTIQNFASLNGTNYLQNMEEILKKCGNNELRNEKYVATRRLLEIVCPFRLNDRQLNNVYTRIFEVLNGYITTAETLCTAAAVPIQPEVMRKRCAELLQLLGGLTPSLFTNSSVTFALNKAVKLWRDRDVEVAESIFRVLAAISSTLPGVQVHQAVLTELLEKSEEFFGKEKSGSVTGTESKFAVRIINNAAPDRVDTLQRVLQWIGKTLNAESADDRLRTVAVAALGEMVVSTSGVNPTGNSEQQMEVDGDGLKSGVEEIVLQKLMKIINFSEFDEEQALDSEGWVSRDQLPADVQLLISALKAAGKYVRFGIITHKNVSAGVSTPQRTFLKQFFDKLKEGLVDADGQMNALDTVSQEHLVLAMSSQLMKSIAPATAHAGAPMNYLWPLLSVFPKLSMEESREEYTRVLLLSTYKEIEPGRLLAAVASAAYPTDNKNLPFRSLIIRPTMEAVKQLRKRVARDADKYGLCVPELSLLYLIHTLAADPEFKEVDKLKNCVTWLEKQGPALYALVDILVTDHQQYSPGIICKIMQVAKKAQLAGHLPTSKAHLKAHVLCDYVLALLEKRLPNCTKDCVISLQIPKDILEIDKNAQTANADAGSHFTMPVSISKRSDGTVAVLIGSQDRPTTRSTAEPATATRSSRKRTTRSRSSHADSESKKFKSNTDAESEGSSVPDQEAMEVD